jgi:hypothetical protein
VEKGEDCDLYAAQASASPATSSNATVNGQQKDKRPPGSGHGDKDAGTPSSMSIAQVRVLGRSTDSNISLAASEAVQKSFEKSPTDSRSDHRPQSPGEPSPVPSVEPEDAILIVEDFDRTRTFRL